MKNIKYIITDLDGTILKSTNDGLSKETINTIREFQNKYNYKLTIATGRHINMVTEYIDLLNIKLPIITSNGGLIKDVIRNKTINVNAISKDDYRTILKKLKKLNIDVVVYSSKNIYGEKSSNRIKSIIKYNSDIKNTKYKINYISVDNILELINLDDDVLKLLLTLNNHDKDLKNIKEVMKPYSHLIISRSRDDLYDINNISATKGTALKLLCDNLNVSTKEVLVYGDNQNDLDMFKEAGYCVATGNALSEVKKIANEIIGNVETNAVAKHLKEKFLEK